MNKIFSNADAAIADLTDGSSILVGGFGLCGIPENLIEAVRRKGTKNLTVISNNCGAAGRGLARLLETGQLARLVASFPGENKPLEKLVAEGKVELELMPQGTFVERIRAGGAGIAAFYTPTGVGTVVAEGKEAREFDGRAHLLERALRADFTFVKAWKGDRWGNLVYRKTARNFNPVMATAARARHQVHASAHTAHRLARNHPACQVPLLIHFHRAEHSHVHVPATNHRKRVGARKVGGAGELCNRLLAGVHQVWVLLALRGRRANAEHSIFRVKHHFDAGWKVVRDQRRNADAEIDDVAVMELSGNPAGDEFALVHADYLLPIRRFSRNFSY
ncbi:MAG: hypothetical protein DMG21_20050, partial [Acidobacteria bacterium]